MKSTQKKTQYFHYTTEQLNKFCDSIHNTVFNQPHYIADEVNLKALSPDKATIIFNKTNQFNQIASKLAIELITNKGSLLITGVTEMSFFDVDLNVNQLNAIITIAQMLNNFENELEFGPIE